MRHIGLLLSAALSLPAVAGEYSTRTYEPPIPGIGGASITSVQGVGVIIREERQPEGTQRTESSERALDQQRTEPRPAAPRPTWGLPDPSETFLCQRKGTC